MDHHTVYLLGVAGGVVVEDDEVSVGDVEAGEVVDGVLGIVDVVVDHVGCPSRVLGGAPACIHTCRERSEVQDCRRQPGREGLRR